MNKGLDVNTWEVEGSNDSSTYEYLGKLPDWCKGTDVDLMSFSLDVQKLKTFHVVNVHALQVELSSGTYLGMLPDWDEDQEGDPGSLLSVDVQEVRTACWDLPWDSLTGMRTKKVILVQIFSVDVKETEGLLPWDPPRDAF